MEISPKRRAPQASGPEDPGQREDWEHEADAARTRLVVTLGELDRRGRHLFDTRAIIAEHRRAIGIVIAATALVAAAAVFIVARRRASRPRRVRKQRVEALQRIWQHPEWVAPKRPNMWFELGRRLSLTAVESVGTRALERLLDAPQGASPRGVGLAQNSV
jgi:hypothetical protein